jgi:predicted N-acetyltransferase YhbS
MMGLGIGTALVRWGIESASGKGVPIRTETTENNQAFYEKLGFLKTGEWIMTNVSDGVDMTLPIMEWR